MNIRNLEILDLDEATEAAGDPDALAGQIGTPVSTWAGNCHSVSLALLRTGRFGRGRVARGLCPGVRSQHSWIILGDDCYDPDAVLVDPTLYASEGEIYVGYNGDGGHRPHGWGSCFAAGLPHRHDGPVLELTPVTPLSPQARGFLASLGPLDKRGWAEVAHLPVQDWPAAEIISAMLDTKGLGVLVPIDIAGMLTDRNPRNLYW
jgi:hypothetical protein